MNFGFVVHPITRAQAHFVGIRTLQPGLALGGARASHRARVKRVADFPEVRSPTGATTRGTVWAVPYIPDALIADQSSAVTRITEAVELAVADGAEIVGLGALCAVVGLRGEEVAKSATVPVTTGVSFTAAAAIRTLEVSLEKLGEKCAGTKVLIAGLPGALATCVAHLVAAREGIPVLAGGSIKAREKLAAAIPGAEQRDELEPAVRESRTIVGASSTGRILQASWLQRGTLLVDVAEPRDLDPAGTYADVLVVEGENVTLPAARLPLLTRAYNTLVGQRAQTIYACFAEPMVLALEGRAESFSLGKQIPPDKAEEIGRLAAGHGFAVGPLLRAGRVIPAATWARMRTLR